MKIPFRTLAPSASLALTAGALFLRGERCDHPLDTSSSLNARRTDALRPH